MSTQTPGSHFFVLTVEHPGRCSLTQTGTFTPPPHCTRQEAYHQIYAAVIGDDPDLKGANCVFFSLEPNRL